MTIQKLNTRQGWTLNQKIDHAVGTVEAFLSRTGKVPYVSFSGGKDSTVLLDIVRRFVNRDIKAVFLQYRQRVPRNSALRQNHRERNDNTAGNYGKGSYRQIWISAYIERTSIVYKGD